MSGWDLGAALVALPLTAVLAAKAIAVALPAHRRGSRAEHWIRSSLVLLAVIAVEVAATFATPLDGATSVFLFLGVSLLVAAWRGDAGCEAVAIPNALSRRLDATGCVVFSAVDTLDGGRRLV